MDVFFFFKTFLFQKWTLEAWQETRKEITFIVNIVSNARFLLLVFNILVMFKDIETCLHLSTEPFKIRNDMLYYMVFNAVFQMYVIKILCILRQQDMAPPCLIYHALYRSYRARQRRVVFKYKWQMRTWDFNISPPCEADVPFAPGMWFHLI